MAANNTLKFLPAIFQTDTNKKFLNATLDQLTSEADLRRVNGYIGRKFAPTYKTTDNYVTEPTTARQNYQLEPSVVVQDKEVGTVNLFSTYVDLIQQIDVLGGNTKDHSRLFANESYTFDGLFDFDKFANYNDYYWLPNGPDAVQVYAGVVDKEQTYTVTRNLAASGYNFSGSGTGANPVLTLARGGSYKFNVDQGADGFWIQSEPGLSGTKSLQSNISTRNIFGVDANGSASGQVIFNVPRADAQDVFSKMPQVASVDFVTPFTYNQIQNQLLSVLLAAHPDVFDGVTTELNKKTLAFINQEQDDVFWETPGIWDHPLEGFDEQYYDAGEIVLPEHRRSLWTIELQPSEDNDYLVVLVPDQVVNANERIFVKSGTEYATNEYYFDRLGIYQLVPQITATLDTLYYQDGSAEGLVGIIKIVDSEGYAIDVAADILGRKSYKSPNDVVFTNGLKIQFDKTTTDEQYWDNEYYVEGVGTSISLVKLADLVTPEAYAVNGIDTPDYITINRDSIDHNAWSRSNCWFHVDVITATAAYNNTVALPDQNSRAQRPIIEFEGHLQLYNAGRVAKLPVDLLVNGNVITDAMNTVEGAFTGGGVSATVSGVTFTDGMRVIFANDSDSSVQNSIYQVQVIDTTGGVTSDRKLHLILADDYLVSEGHCINVTQGTNAGLNFWYDGASWNQGQLKTGINQKPMFDVVDSNGYSLSNVLYYPVSSFVGTPIFSYTTGTGSNDKVLGFPLSYRNFNSIGDIQFTNNFDSDTVTYASGASTVTIPINYNFFRQNTTLTEYTNRNIWKKNVEATKQYQIFSYAYNGTTNYFPVDVLPEAESVIPYTKVFVNNQLLKSSNYEYKLVGARQTVRVDYTLLSAGDKVDILIYSKTPAKAGYYEIPSSLDFNSKNAKFTSLTLGQIRNHVTSIKQNTKLAVDAGSIDYKGLRDIQYKGNGGNILQQSAPAMYSNIFLTDKNLNFVRGIDLAAREYSRFKNKFLELATKINEIDPKDIAGSVDTILKSINTIKNKTFPWYYSDMVPYGDNKNVINYTVINPFTKQYEITQVFDDTVLSNQAVLVYLNNVQLVNGVDFTFPQDRSAIVIGDTITLVAGDKIQINEYYDTDGCFIPETPSKLGLYPKFIPTMFSDSSYISPVDVIQGHDGSITPAFGDIRDDFLLELEKRIYNNIKISYETHIFDLYDHLPGKFRNTDYTLKEFNQILSSRFLRWVGDNRVDYSTNSYFESGNPWTWNYKKFKDRVTGEQLPGTWRAIFSYFFDTYRPNTHPWEMLGFGQKPTWWEERYGAAPYTGSNTLLWEDLAAGYIHAGPRAGIDTRFARPGLMNIIPVDDYGDLLSPEKWASATFSSLKANASYSVGDQGPVEFAWRTSSFFPYALQFALALSKPGYYFGSLVNIDRYYRNTSIDQLINSETRQRITPTTVVINGDTTDGTTVRAAGYLNWIRDYVLNLGIDPNTTIRTYLDTVSIQLGYKVGGYTDTKFIQVLAEQGSPTNTNNSIIIPTENYSVRLNESTPIRKAVYSAVVVEKTENGYTVNGYNQNSPYFTVIPSLANNNYYIIQALKARGVIYKDYQPVKLTIPYGYEFASTQEVVDFLTGYSRYLVAQGFKFDKQDDNLGETRNWVLSAKEFLNWSQQGWNSGSIIVLSPVFDEITNVQPDGVVSYIENTPGGTKILDQNSNFIKNTQFTEVRTDNTFKLTAIGGQTICLADLTVVQYEHSVLFDNVTVFNDILYVPELGNRQFRLKLIGSKTGSWAGALNPPGFVYNNNQVDAWQPGVDYLLGSIVQYKTRYYTALSNIPASAAFTQDGQWRLISSADIKTGLLPNFAYNATRLQQVYDVDNLPADSTFEGYGTSLIGFRKRAYLSEFGLDETSQVKFYQGFIKEKGTLNAITGLTNARANDLTSEIDIYEEWALRVGEYGAMISDQIVELELSEEVITTNPAPLEFLNDGEADSQTGVVGYHPVDLYKAPAGFTKNLFFVRDSATETISDIETAGYVNLTDIDATLYSFDTYADLDTVLPGVGPGYYVWVAKNYSSLWDVYRITETQTNVTNLTYDIDNLMTVNFSDFHNMSAGDVFAVKAFDERFNGFYQVYTVTSDRSVQVITRTSDLLAGEASEPLIKGLKTIDGYGVFYKLQSARLTDLVQADGIIPLNGWEDGDKLWVDTATADSTWAVYEKTTAWNKAKLVTDESALSNAQFGTTITSNKLANNFFVGMPAFSNSDGSTGTVRTFSRTANTVTQTSRFDPRANTVSSYGAAMSASDYRVAIGAPKSNTNQGYVYVYDLATSTVQIIRSNVAPASSDYFGNAVAISGDNDWLYVGIPGKNSTYVYHYESNVVAKSNTITYVTDTVASAYTLSYTPYGNVALQISDTYRNYVLDVDFSLSGNVITFIRPPDDPYTKISITQRPFYKNTSKIIIPSDVSAGDRFGEVVQTSDYGQELFIGAPGQNSNAGAVYVYRLFEQSFKSVLENSYTFAQTIGSLAKVYVDGVLQSATTYNTAGAILRFNTPVSLGRVVNIVSDQFELVQKITEPTQSAGNLFGSQITIDHINASAVYISAPGTILSNGQSGAVYRYSETGKVLGSITADSDPDYIIASIKNGGSTFNSNIGIYINSYYVDLADAIVSANVEYTGVAATSTGWDRIEFPAGYAKPDVCARLINAAQIPMVSAAVASNGFITINSSSLTNNNKLSIRSNGSNLFSMAGLPVYELDQQIVHPAGSIGQGFASSVKYNPETETLLISSTGDDVYYMSEVDTGTTTFDQSSTRVIDIVKSSGSVYVYEKLTDPNTGITNTGTMSYAQHIKSTALKTGDSFGTSIDINKDLILIGAPGDDSVAANAGGVYAYTNLDYVSSWNVIRTQTEKVDLNNINKIFVYDKTTQLILASLDYIDPAKGKILGIAEQDIDYKTALDPAIYNTGPATYNSGAGVTRVVNQGYHWNERQVGKIWWNLSTLRYLDYEQDDLIYRSNNWGKLFPGSQVIVCEWTESNYPPVQYINNSGDGRPLFYDTYVTITTVVSGKIVPKYYYWVIKKQNAAPGKRFNVSVLEDIIENPQLQGIPYALVMKQNSVGLVNIESYLSASDTVLHIDYQKIRNENSVHAEYELINENDPESTVPTRIIDKLIDSLSGIDTMGQVVPDPTLTAVNQIGISIRPRQTMVIDRSKAVENFVKYVNGVLVQYPIVYQYSLLGMEKVDPVPASTEYDKVVPVVEDVGYIDTTELSVGYRVLVTSDSTNSGLWTIYRLDSNKQFQTYRIQYFNTALYWDKIDWYASDYDPTGRLNYTVTAYKDIAALTLKAGEVIRVNYDDGGQFGIYRVKSDLTIEKVGIQNGTIQLKSTLYDLAAGQMGWDEDRFDTVRFDQTPSIEIRNILIALRDDIFINALGDEFNKLFFVLVNYILQEQVSVDWIFKTSFINVFHKLRELSQPPSFVLDNQGYYQQYIEEVKPYRTILREYVVDYTGSDTVGSNVTDFDLPSLYSKTLAIYRTPSGERTIDSTLLNITPEYQYWNKYHSFSVGSIEISNAGTGYLAGSNIAVTVTGGGGSGATANATVWLGNGTIRSVTVTNPGSGYTSAPTVIINGTGVNGLAAARLVNQTVRQVDSRLKFDRTAYDSNVQIWSSANSYVAGSIVAYNGQAYSPSANVSASANFDFDTFKVLTGDQAGNANDRIIAYLASRSQLNLDLNTTLGREVAATRTNQFYLTQYINGIEYPGVQVQGLKFNANVADQALLDTVIQSRYVDTGLGTRPEDINIDGGAYIDYYSSHAPEELLPGVVHESVDISVFTNEVFANLTVNPDGAITAYREFLDIGGGHDYLRVSGLATAYLIGNLSITATSITVNDSSLLPVPDLVRAIPGELFIGGEKITYWNNDTATNTLTNIRRGVGGTANQFHQTGSIVYDASKAQRIPGLNARTALISSNSSFSSNSSINYWRSNSSSSTFTTVDNVTYKLTLNGNITANCGDYITQLYSGANAVVRGNVTSAKSVAVTFLTGNITTANANCILRVNGVSSVVAPNAISILGSVNAVGNVTITAPTVAGFTTNVEIYQDTTAWYDYDALILGVPGTTGLQNSSTVAAVFLGLGATALVTDITAYYSTEDEPATVNTIMITENSQILTQE